MKKLTKIALLTNPDPDQFINQQWELLWKRESSKASGQDGVAAPQHQQQLGSFAQKASCPTASAASSEAAATAPSPHQSCDNE